MTTRWRCYGGDRCDHKFDASRQGISQYCICADVERRANEEIGRRVRAITEDHAPTERVWISALTRIIEAADGVG